MPLHEAAQNGHAAVVDQLISAGATVDAADTGGRGPGRVFGSFLGWLSGSDEVMEGFRTLAGDFCCLSWHVELCLLLNDPYLLSWDGLLDNVGGYKT